jgi:hypothetical protein
MAKTGAVAAVVLACTLSVQADARLAGIWNLKVPVGNIGAGVRTVLLKVEEKGGRLTAKITNIGNKAEDVDKLEVSDGRLVVEYGAYKYDLKIVDDDRIAGTVTSPSGAHQVTGARQEKLLYAGDDPAPFHRFWIGSVGLRGRAAAGHRLLQCRGLRIRAAATCGASRHGHRYLAGRPYCNRKGRTGSRRQEIASRKEGRSANRPLFSQR